MATAALKRPWLVLAGLALGVCATHGFARLAYGLLLPAMQSEMGWTYAQAGWLNTANAPGSLGGAVLTMLLIRRFSAARLFAFGMVTTTLALLATGLDAGLGWQTFWRFAVGLLGALSFSTAGTLAAGLFQGDAHRNALAIALLFGTGGGVGVVLTGGSLPLILPPQAWGRAFSLFTLVFAVAQIAGPHGAGLVGDLFGNIGVSLLVAAGLLLVGAGLALLQRPLQPPAQRTA